MRESHQSVFAEWLQLELPDQKEDLSDYFAGLGEELPRLVETWVRLTPYRGYAPTVVRAADRQLFQSDLAILIEIIRVGLGVSGPDPGD